MLPRRYPMLPTRLAPDRGLLHHALHQRCIPASVGLVLVLHLAAAGPTSLSRVPDLIALVRVVPVPPVQDDRVGGLARQRKDTAWVGASESVCV